MPFDYDFIIIGSGFGGSVSAMRLAEKGYSVCVLERGKRYRAEDFPKTNWDLRRYLWAPLIKCFGIQNMSLFRNILILSGTGVGGGSLVYANTLLQPGDEFFEALIWRDLADWKGELQPCYDRARRMLGVVTNPKFTFVDKLLKECADEMGRGDTFKPSEVAVYFGEPGKVVPDPYFGGAGPDRAGCNSCGGCMVGCKHNAKNSLDKNYLYFAEKFGAKMIPERNVVDLRPLEGGGYRVDTVRSTAWFAKEPYSLTARNVVVSAGVLGTLQLLFKCKEVTGSLPRISDRLGHEVRTNSEAIVGLADPNAPSERNYSEGIAISSIFHPDDHTHIEPVRYPSGSDFMKILAVPMIDGDRPVLRAIKLILTVLTQPWRVLRYWFNRRWPEKALIFLVMQTLDNKMRFALGRGLFTLFRKSLVTRPEGDSYGVPAYIPVGHQVARAFGRKVGGEPQNAVNEVLMNIPTTAHILGGCAIGPDSARGVIDLNHQVFGYPGLYVCDGSTIPANLGVNPSLTITALTERAMSRIPPKDPAKASAKIIGEAPMVR